MLIHPCCIIALTPRHLDRCHVQAITPSNGRQAIAKPSVAEDDDTFSWCMHRRYRRFESRHAAASLDDDHRRGIEGILQTAPHLV